MFAEHPLADPQIQRYRDYARQRQMTLGDLLLENRIVFLEGVINDLGAYLKLRENHPIVEFGIYDTDKIYRGEAWRLITANLLHANLIHLA